MKRIKDRQKKDQIRALEPVAFSLPSQISITKKNSGDTVKAGLLLISEKWDGKMVS